MYLFDFTFQWHFPVIVGMGEQWTLESNLTVAADESIWWQGTDPVFCKIFHPLNSCGGKKKKKKNQFALILGRDCHLLAEDGSNLK